jgi:hypothetical protein
MDLAMDVYIAEDYVRSRYKQNMLLQKRDSSISLNENKGADDKFLPGDKNKLPSSALKIVMSTCTSTSRSSSFIEDIFLNCFAP